MNKSSLEARLIRIERKTLNEKGDFDLAVRCMKKAKKDFVRLLDACEGELVVWWDCSPSVRPAANATLVKASKLAEEKGMTVKELCAYHEDLLVSRYESEINKAMARTIGGTK